MKLSKEFEQGIHARSIQLPLVDNPYSPKFKEKHTDWSSGWKLEDWRITKMGRIHVDGVYNSARKNL